MLISDFINSGEERFDDFTEALFSFSHSDFSEEARLFLQLLFIVERFMLEGIKIEENALNRERKRFFIFAGHAIDRKEAKFSYRELANWILQLGLKLQALSATNRVVFIPNLSNNQATELALLPTIDVFESLHVDDWSQSATLASL